MLQKIEGVKYIIPFVWTLDLIRSSASFGIMLRVGEPSCKQTRKSVKPDD
jgi:hypothetical protein